MAKGTPLVDRPARLNPRSKPAAALGGQALSDHVKDVDKYTVGDRHSGYVYATPATRGMQDDDFSNPAFLWLEHGEEQWKEFGPIIKSEQDKPLHGRTRQNSHDGISLEEYWSNWFENRLKPKTGHHHEEEEKAHEEYNLMPNKSPRILDEL